MRQLLRRRSSESIRPLHLVSAVAIFTMLIVSIVLVVRSATLPAAFEPENGVLSGGATKVTNSSASGGSLLRFGPSNADPFPLKVSANRRYLVDQNNTPFFVAADTAWSLLTKLSVNDAKRVIDLRKAQGFNVIQTTIVFPSRVDSGPHGTPFQGSDMTKPNEAYFAAVDQIMAYAKTQGIVLYTGTFWKTDNGAACIDGFPVAAPFPTDTELRSYANYLGNRYKNQTNLMWYNGGDGEPNCQSGAMGNFGNYLKAADPNHLLSYHTWNKANWAAGQSWLDFNSFQWNSNSWPYSYLDVRELYNWSPTKPTFDMEPAYEPNACCGNDMATSLQENRRSGWWAVLSGAMGVAYGGPEQAWNVGASTGGVLNEGAITRPSATHTGNIRKIMKDLQWYNLASDWDNQTVTGGRGSYGGDDYVTAGLTPDRSLIMAYTPSARSLTVNLAQLAGGGTARWYDPVSGNAVGSAQAVSNSGSQTFNTPGNNSGGDSDWVLIISSGQSVTPTPTPPVTLPLRIDSGSSATYTDEAGNAWRADQYYTGNSAQGGGGATAVTNTITNTGDPKLYQTERWGVASYDVPLPNGTYTVKLHFAEVNPASGTRVFSVTAEGQSWLTNFNITTAAGAANKANVQTKLVTVSDGVLNIGFTASQNASSVSAIEISN